MELLDTLLRHPPGEVAVFTYIMHDLSDALQGGDDPRCREWVSSRAMNEASRMLPVSTRIEIPRKWLISSSSAVNLSSPICLPRCQMGCTVGSGNSHLLISPLTCSLLASGSWRHAAKCCIWPFSTIAREDLPLLAQRREGLLCRRAVAKYRGGFEAAPHGRGSELKIFLRVLLERED